MMAGVSALAAVNNFDLTVRARQKILTKFRYCMGHKWLLSASIPRPIFDYSHPRWAVVDRATAVALFLRSVGPRDDAAGRCASTASLVARDPFNLAH